MSYTLLQTRDLQSQWRWWQFLHNTALKKKKKKSFNFHSCTKYINSASLTKNVKALIFSWKIHKRSLDPPRLICFIFQACCLQTLSQVTSLPQSYSVSHSPAMSTYFLIRFCTFMSRAWLLFHICCSFWWGTHYIFINCWWQDWSYMLYILYFFCPQFHQRFSCYQHYCWEEENNMEFTRRQMENNQHFLTFVQVQGAADTHNHAHKPHYYHPVRLNGIHCND